MQVVTDQSAVQVAIGRLGRGVFATRPLREGDTVEIVPTLEVGEGDASGLLGDYVFDSNNGGGKVVLMLGYGMLYNHSPEPNAEYVEHSESTVAFVAIKDIEVGDEVMIDYGDDWWDTRGRVPE